MRNKLTDDEKDTLMPVLIGFNLPEKVINHAIEFQGQLLFKYFQQNKDFILKTKQGSYALPFSRAVSSSFNPQSFKDILGLTEPSKPNFEKTRELLKPEPNNETPIEPKPLNDLPPKKGRGLGRAKPESRISFTFLVDSSDFEKLNQIAISEDLSTAHLVRAAIKDYLKQKRKVN